MLGWLPIFLIYEEERQKKLNNSDYESPYDIDVTDISGWDVLIGIAIGLSPFILAAIIILIVK